MPGLFLAPTSITVPEPPGVDRSGLQQVWTGWDGTRWGLTDPGSGVRLLRGYRGLTTPPLEHLTTSSPALAGSRHRGVRWQDRPVFWPIYLYRSGGSQEWMEHDRAWFRSLHPARTGVWSVIHPDGTVRSLRCRFVDDGQKAFDLDPTRAGWAKYALNLVAQEPFWRGAPVRRAWRGSTPQPFFGTDGGPPFYISSSHTLSSAEITNPGDEDAWLDFTITGPSSAVSVGVPGRLVQVGWNIAEGRLVRISTDPERQTAYECDTPPVDLVGDAREAWIDRELVENGVERTHELVTARFTPVPAYETVPLALTLTGSGSVEVSLVPSYHRAW